MGQWPFMRIMKWSFSALFAGTWPRRDWRGVAYEPGSSDGEPLADGYFACLIGLCGDLDYCAKFLGHPRWSSHSEPCGLCRATFRGPLTWLNFSENAPWEGTQWTPETWARRPIRSTCPLFEMPGFTSIAVLPDYMHNKYLGYAQYLFGSVFWLLCFVHMAAAPLQNLRTLANFIMSFQNRHRPQHGERYPARTLRKLTMFVKKRDFPKLRGKGGQIRGLGDAMIAMWKRYGDLHARHSTSAAESLYKLPHRMPPPLVRPATHVYKKKCAGRLCCAEPAFTGLHHVPVLNCGRPTCETSVCFPLALCADHIANVDLYCGHAQHFQRLCCRPLVGFAKLPSCTYTIFCARLCGFPCSNE